MLLPIESLGIDGGCNFVVALAMCNMISGIARVLYTPAGQIPRGRDGAAIRFKSILRDFFSWELAENREGKINILYDVFRNPLTHSLGVQDEPRKRRVWILKSPLDEAQITELETSEHYQRCCKFSCRYSRLSVE